MNLKAVCLAGVLPWSLSASEIPELILPAGVGVNIHFTRGHERDLDLIAAAGFRFVRMDFSWEGTERTKNQFDWSAYDELTANLEKRGLRAYYILDYSNPLYEETVASRNPITGKEESKGTASPQHAESVAAFARWAGAAARHFQGRHVLWEIWNEPNIFFWKPKPAVEQYTALALATCQSVREANPRATIVAPATSEFPWEFLESFLKSGVLRYLDGVSVHPYRSKNKPPETAADDYQRLRQLIERCAPDEAKKKIPIISGEWGYSSHAKGVSLETQAAFIARQQLANLAQGIPISIWYDWKNDGQDPNENEHNFGTVAYDLTLKPAYEALRTLTRELSGHQIVRRVAADSDKDFVLLLRDAAQKPKLAAWTTGEPHEASFDVAPASPSRATAVRGRGGDYQPRVDKTKLWLELESAPQYVTLQ
jgi:hypothetical protein